MKNYSDLLRLASSFSDFFSIVVLKDRDFYLIVQYFIVQLRERNK